MLLEIYFIHFMNGKGDSSEGLLKKKVGNRLREIRKSQGYKNSDDFAFKHEINRSQYGKYEAGSVDMQISSLAKILKLMDVSLKDFFSEGFD